MARPTLNDLEGDIGGTPVPTTDSILVTKSHRLRKKPVDDFTVEDLRTMISQEIGLEHLMPPAISALEREPLAEGNTYPGDLLVSVVACTAFLQANPELLARVLAVAKRAVAGHTNDALSGVLLPFLAKGSKRAK